MQGFDHKTDEEQGYEDALNGFPRASTRPFYRRGYDRGLTEKSQARSAPRPLTSRRNSGETAYGRSGHGSTTGGGTEMTASVELHSLGFAVVDDFGPEGRRPVIGFEGDTTGELIFHARFRAQEYAAARDAHAAIFADGGYKNPAEWDARQRCKDLAREHGRVYVSAATVEP